MAQGNFDKETIERFGVQWQQLDQAGLADEDRRALFEGYFRLFPPTVLNPDAVGIDVGCGSGRWAVCVAPHVGHLHCVDRSAKCIDVARMNLADFSNCEFHVASVDAMPIEDNSLDFAYCLGMLHYTPIR